MADGCDSLRSLESRKLKLKTNQTLQNQCSQRTKRRNPFILKALRFLNKAMWSMKWSIESAQSLAIVKMRSFMRLCSTVVHIYHAWLDDWQHKFRLSCGFVFL